MQTQHRVSNDSSKRGAENDGGDEEGEDSLWSEGSYKRPLNPSDPDFHERMKYFHEEKNAPKEHSCKKCKVAIGKHNLYWHEGMCNECFFGEYDL